jgi:2-succinyl-5-enolpyruvyl-6-hydroxy-3-cyclohexene-1-carboxylate synthase
VAEWAQTLGWPLIGDVLSQTGQPLPCADLWLGNGKAVSELAQAQIVVQLGSSLTGKRVLQWQATCEPDEYWLVDNLPVASTRRSTAAAVCSPALTAGLSCIRRKTPAVGDGHS